MKALKILVQLLLAAYIIVVGGAAAFVAFSDPNDFKDLIAEKVRDQTGRELTLEGPLEWAFWPKLRLKAGPLSLSNAPGFGDEPMFAADEIQVAVATLPLMRERIEMDTIKLHGVIVNLVRNAEGVTNWQDLAGGDGETEPHGGGLASFVLGGVDIKEARITWSDAATEQKITISKVNAVTGELTFGDPIDFNASLTVVANKPALDGDVSLTGTVSYNLDDERYQVNPLAFKAILPGRWLPLKIALNASGFTW